MVFGNGVENIQAAAYNGAYGNQYKNRVFPQMLPNTLKHTALVPLHLDALFKLLKDLLVVEVSSVFALAYIYSFVPIDILQCIMLNCSGKVRKYFCPPLFTELEHSARPELEL